jgi:hypothetical protein
MEGVKQEKPIDEATKDSKGTHQSKEPEPAWTVTNTTHMQDTIHKELCQCLAELVTKVEDHDTLRSLAACVPG